jgi:simple sugar transport system ATP-binding protein
MSDTVPRLALHGITKRYPAVVANNNVSLAVPAGEIHAVLGENGAGKSTLMKIIYGVSRPDAGTILWEGKPVHITSPAAARALGIGMVFQHFSLFETLTVAENIALGLDQRIAPAALASRIREVSVRYGLPLDPGHLVHDMSVGERQRVEIVRCLLQDPKLLIMDEPTSVLAPQAVQTLFETLRRLASEGCSILYISHKLDEIRALCDTATVLRGGVVSGRTIPRKETSESLARLMIGAEIPKCHLDAHARGEVRLQLAHLSHATLDPFGTALKDIDLEVHGGEIVGIAGVSGNGQKELVAVLTGEARLHDAGSIRLCGIAAGTQGAAARRAAGLAVVPEERLGRGAVPALSLAHNALLTASRHGMVSHGVVKRATASTYARNVIDRFKVKCGGERSAASSLSGGNLQKFIVGRETQLHPRVMVVAQPTWGVDVGSSMMIRQALIDLRDEGVALLVISEDLDELFMISDRIAVISQGRLSPAIPAAQAGVEQIGAWMGGSFAHA